MALAKDYDSVMGRSNEIMKKALGLDYNDFESGSVAFDYEALMKSTGYTLDEIARIQSEHAVGNTPPFSSFKKVCKARIRCKNFR